MISVSRPSVWVATAWPEAPTLNHTVRLSGVAQDAKVKKTSNQAWYAKGLETTSQTPKARSLLEVS